MPGGKKNPKADGQLRKAQANDSKKAAEEAAKEAAVDWESGAKGVSKSKVAQAEKTAELARKKAERLAIEEAENAESAKKPTQRQDKKAAQTSFKINSFETPVETLSARGIENALDLLDLTSKGTAATNADKLDRHPERRVKAGFTAFEEYQMPILKAENPSLRLSQLKQMIHKLWLKSPDNPLNQAHIAYNTSRTDEKSAITSKREEDLNAFRS